MTSETASGRKIGTKALLVVAAWTLMAAAWTPPTVALQISVGAPRMQLHFGFVFLYVLVGFVPWIALTPLVLWLARRFPITETQVGRPLAILAGIGVVLTPVAVLAGYGLNALLRGHHDWATVLRAAYITSFYNIPFYVALVATGQAIAYFERARLRERLLARAELRALQAQIRPHFLFNTLNAIAAVGYRDVARADAAMVQLSELLRALLGEHPPEIALKDELAFVQGYLDLYTLLMPDRLKVQMEVEPAVWEAMVPSMLLQPLVENAIVHGVARRTQGGRISLAAAAEGPSLVLSIRNDAPDRVGTSTGAGTALANVRERLKVLFGAAQSLEFVTGAEPCVTVRLPLKHASAPA
ncbi:MAG: sensor histidine kinase [Steroidobacteraceae bacterium]